VQRSLVTSAAEWQVSAAAVTRPANLDDSTQSEAGAGVVMAKGSRWPGV